MPTSFRFRFWRKFEAPASQEPVTAQAAYAPRAVNLGGDGFAGEREERVRLLRADADMRQIELAKERSQLVALSDVEAAMTDLAQTTKACVMAIAPQLAPELVGETSRVMIQAKIDKAHRKALSCLAKAANGHEHG